MPYSLLEGAAMFTGLSLKIEEGTKKAAHKAGRIVQKEAKRVLGTYDYDWPPLAESTIERKKTGDSPGLETGEMRASIKMEVVGHRLDWEVYVGSNNPKALWFELGTIHQPPRSFLAGAAVRKEHEIRELCGHKLFSWAAGVDSSFDDDWSYDSED